ncbi:hypothetical protein CVT24_000204 [Panaeolus cyanescens]|uniref:Beta-mannosidase B n=1 Tax=Panaeolus cyanescens TaxID=181874 RepID=A0A409VIL1_9AGAR|nr:hypothetical protein CVT24_000204 [Panaeolus cyanescens]
MASNSILQLGKDHWQWKQRNRTQELLVDAKNPIDWTAVTGFPSEIHVELLAAGKILHPHIGFNEHKALWVADEEWLYMATFPFSNDANHKHGILVFEGLDTVCDVYLNNVLIISADNQFRTWVYDLDLLESEVLKVGSNTLLLHFKSAKALAKSEEAKYGKVRAGSTNLGDPSRVYVRKAQYDWRWDWGPEVITCGPYRSVYLKTFNTRIDDFYPHANVTFVEGKPSIILDSVATLVGNCHPNSCTLKFTLATLDGTPLKEAKVYVPAWEGKDVKTVNAVWGNLHDDQRVELWWPVGYGKQNLYDVTVELLTDNDHVIDRSRKRIGFRTVELIQEELAEDDQYGRGTTFLFQVNGVRMFMGGSNWVPADNFFTTISDDRYRAWLTLLRDGNQNMVRIWGGGIYEPDVFYDICDELGILVWQDFQFACGVYPAHTAFVQSVRKEAEDNVKRLRHHASLALFCGNNEDYQMVLQWGGINDLPARILYEDVLPEVVNDLTRLSVPYHRGSPYGGKGWDTADPTIGDVHQWNIWGGKELPYHEYDRMGGRFVSEFGIPAMPSLQTIKYWMQNIDDEKQWYAQSQAMAQHTKAGAFERRFAIVMNENFRLTEDLETHVFNTQMMQSEALGHAYRSWKREWRGPGKQFIAGILVWQLNDCWPGVSWAIADYFASLLRAKPSYYTMARILAPISVEVTRTVVKNRDNDRPRQYYEFGATQTKEALLDVWATNSGLTPRTLRLELNFFDINTDWRHQSESRDVTLLPNQTTELVSQMVCIGPAPPSGASYGDPAFVTTATVVAQARLVDVDTGEVIARCSNWPEPYRFLQPPKTGVLEVKPTSLGGGNVEFLVTASRPVKCVFFSAEGEGSEKVLWSDNALDLVPGDSQRIIGRNLDKDYTIKVAHFGQEKSYAVFTS